MSNWGSSEATTYWIAPIVAFHQEIIIRLEYRRCMLVTLTCFHIRGQIIGRFGVYT